MFVSLIYASSSSSSVLQYFLVRVGFNAIKLKAAWLQICLDFLIMNCCLEISRTFFVCIYWLDKKRNLLQIFFAISRFIHSHNLINQVDLSFEEIFDISWLLLFTYKDQKVFLPWFTSKPQQPFIVTDTWFPWISKTLWA